MDELERRIRAASPMSRSRNLPLSDRAKRELADLLLSDTQVQATSPKKPSGRRKSSRLMAMAAVLMVALGLGQLWPSATPPAGAVTPPMLTIHPVAMNTNPLKALAASASQRLDPQPGDTVITVQSWVLNIEVGGAGSGPVVISPQISTTTIRSDGSMSKVVTAGQAHSPSGTVVPDQDPAPGTVLGRLEQTAEEYAPLFAAPAPRDPELVEGFLRDGSGLETAQASNALLAVNYLMQEQRLDSAQIAALITFLADLPGLKVDGATTDRLGREALVISAEREEGQYSDRLLLDRADGDVLAFESVYIGETRTDLTAPAVTEYHLWEKSQ